MADNTVHAVFIPTFENSKLNNFSCQELYLVTVMVYGTNVFQYLCTIFFLSNFSGQSLQMDSSFVFSHP